MIVVTLKKRERERKKERDTHRSKEQNAEFRNRVTQIWTLCLGQRKFNRGKG